MVVGRYVVVFRGTIFPPLDDLHDLGAEIIDALDDAPVEDPFVATDMDASLVRVEVVIPARDQTEALELAVAMIRRALGSVGIVDERALRAPSAEADELTPA